MTNNKIKSITQIAHISGDSRNVGKTVGLVTGVFDVLHYQHIEFLRFAKSRVDVLIVGMEGDKNVKRFKGKQRPIFNFQERALVLSSIEYVDYVFEIPTIKENKTTQSFYSEFYNAFIKKIDPNFLITSVLQDAVWKEKKASISKLGIGFVVYKKKSKISSTKIISKIESLG
jgi:D-beta-D-heptose 7-phosphate kinase/D-beta-D-heptose 1-phosphate adenosyltransferase